MFTLFFKIVCLCLVSKMDSLYYVSKCVHFALKISRIENALNYVSRSYNYLQLKLWSMCM